MITKAKMLNYLIIVGVLMSAVTCAVAATDGTGTGDYTKILDKEALKDVLDSVAANGDNIVSYSLDGPIYDEFLTYANFGSDNSCYTPGQGVGGYENRLYVVTGQYCYVYEVSMPEGADPNMHPDSADPEEQGPMAPRTLTFIESHDIGTDMGSSTYQSSSAFYVDDTGIYYGPAPGGVHKWDHSWNYQGRVVDVSLYSESLAYDTDNDVWYAGMYDRQIYSFRPGIDTSWQYEFTYPTYEGSHHDGLEYENGFLWISDMTTNWVGQWKKKSDGPWNEVVRFNYDNPIDDDVEGMGYGPFGHLWATGWSRLYEIGGKGLGDVLEGITLSMTLDKDEYNQGDVMQISALVIDKKSNIPYPIVDKVQVKIDGDDVDIEDPIVQPDDTILIKVRAPSEGGDHTIWVQVETDLGSASDSESFTVSGEAPTGTVSVDDKAGTVDEATEKWDYPTKYNAPVFRRGVDNPRFTLTLNSQLTGDDEALFEVYSPNDASTPIGSVKSSFCGADGKSLIGTWQWTDTNGNPLSRDQIPVGIYRVNGSLVSVDDQSDKRDLECSDEFYVIFDFDKMDGGVFVTWDQDYAYKIQFSRCTSTTEKLHQYDKNIWMRAINWTNGNTTVQEAVNSTANLTRTINGNSTFHHLLDDESIDYTGDGYDNDFKNGPDDAAENWNHNYEPGSISNRIYIKDLSIGIGSILTPVWLHKDTDDQYWAQKAIRLGNTIKGSRYHDVSDFVNSDIRPYKAPQGMVPLEPQLESWHPHPIGTCGDYAMLSVAYLRSIGVPAKKVTGWPPIAGSGHSWTWYYNNGGWHHLDTDAVLNKTVWECFRYDRRYYLIGTGSIVSHVCTEKYESGQVKYEDITDRYKPNLDVTLSSYNSSNRELKIKANYPGEYDEELSFTGDFKVFFKVHLYRSYPALLRSSTGGTTSGPIELAPGDNVIATFRVDTQTNPICKDDSILVKAYVWVDGCWLEAGNIQIGESIWTSASSIWQSSSSSSVEGMETPLTYGGAHEHESDGVFLHHSESTTQTENANETIDCSIINMGEFKLGRISPVVVSINNTGDESTTVNIAIGMQTAELSIGVAPTAILVGNKSSIEVAAHSIKEVPVNVSTPSYFSHGLYELMLAPYNDTGIMYMRNYTVNITANYNISISKPEEITIGVPFTFDVPIKNNDTEPICNLTAKLNLHHYFNTTEPLAKDISQLDPDETHTFTWNLTPTDYGELGLDVEVYSDSGCEMKSVDIHALKTPKLSITPTVPEKVEKCDNFFLTTTVFNSGDLPSDAVGLTITPPPNVTANTTSVDLGVIGAHENKSWTFSITQDESEDFVILLNATSANATTENYAFINIVQPEMFIDILKGDETPGIEQHTNVVETLADEPCSVTVYIRNTGDEKLNNVQILTNMSVNEDVGDIDKGEILQVPLEFTLTTPGFIGLNVTVKSDEIEKTITRMLLVEKFNFVVSVPKVEYNQGESVPINISVMNEVPDIRFIDLNVRINISNPTYSQTSAIPLLSLAPFVRKNITSVWDTTGVNNSTYTLVTSLMMADQEVVSEEQYIYLGVTMPSVIVDIGDVTAQSSRTATVPIIINGMTNFGAATVTISYDPAVVQITDVTAGDVGTPIANINNTAGTATIVAYVSTATGPDSPITLAILELSAVGSGGDTSPLTLAITTLADADGTSVSANAESGIFVVGTGVRGDLNRDGILTPADAAIALEIAVGSRPCDAAMLTAADVSEDNRVTSLDALMIMQAAAGAIEL